VGVSGHPGDHPHEHVHPLPAGDGRLEPVDVVGVVDDDQPQPVLDGEGDLVVELGVAVQHQGCRVGTGLEGRDDLAATGDVEPQPFLHHDALDGGAGEGLRREHHPAVRPPTGEAVGVGPGPGAQGVLGDDDRRGADVSGDVVQPCATHSGDTVGIHGGPGWEQVEQGRRHRASVVAGVRGPAWQADGVHAPRPGTEPRGLTGWRGPVEAGSAS
jgi:hypothetical protein